MTAKEIVAVLSAVGVIASTVPTDYHPQKDNQTLNSNNDSIKKTPPR